MGQNVFHKDGADTSSTGVGSADSQVTSMALVYVYICVPHACRYLGTLEESQTPWNWSYRRLVVSRHMGTTNPSPLQEQSVPVTTEPPLQPPSTLVTGTFMLQMTQKLQREGLG